MSDLLQIRRLGHALAEADLPLPEYEQTQRLLAEACGRVAERHGFDAQRLYRETLALAGKETT